MKDEYNKELTREEILEERENLIKFNAFNGNPFMQMVRYLNENYEGDRVFHTDKCRTNIVKSYNITLIAHNASGFDRYLVIYNLDKNITSLKIV